MNAPSGLNPHRTHTCPGGCGRDVANARYACVPCWGRLPVELRSAIIDTSHLGTLESRRRLALTEAAAWYRHEREVEQA